MSFYSCPGLQTIGFINGKNVTSLWVFIYCADCGNGRLEDWDAGGLGDLRIGRLENRETGIREHVQASYYGMLR